MIAVGPDALDDLTRELWEAHATHHQAVIPVPQLHWDALDPFTQDHWRHVARTALAFRPNTAGGRADLGAKAGEVLEAILSHADLNGLRDGVAYASLTVPPELLDEAFAIVGALRG